MILAPGDTQYPITLQMYLGKNDLPVLNAIGNIEILSRKKLALFCSIKCPGKIIIQTYDFFEKFHLPEYAVVGGFHSPMEQECLRILLRNGQPAIYCPARGIEKMRISDEFKKPMDGNRLLIISPFDKKQPRATIKSSSDRNLVVAALAEEIFIPYAQSKGKIEKLTEKVVAWGKTVLTLANKENGNLMERGAKAVGNEFLT
jgi:predicted Rossmann fold nucleotide-binding protein DprA/Smf involved in DNA uptake